MASCDTVTELRVPFSEIDGDLFVAQAFVFLIAGHETSSSTLSFALYELALHPEIQQNLRAEIMKVMSKHDGKLTYDGMQEMLYLDRVVSGEGRREVKQ
jgi:cytochrome P450 family 6